MSNVVNSSTLLQQLSTIYHIQFFSDKMTECDDSKNIYVGILSLSGCTCMVGGPGLITLCEIRAKHAGIVLIHVHEK